MRSSYGPVDVELFGGLEPDGELVRKAKIDVLGEPPNATVRMYQWASNPTKGLPGRFRHFDTLTEAEVIDEHDGGFTVRGISDSGVTENGLPPADAVVTWKVTVRGCEDCQ